MFTISSTNYCFLFLGRPAEEVGLEAATSLFKDLQFEACVDTYLQDQLIMLMALAKGYSKIKTGPITMHTKTAIYIAVKMTKVSFFFVLYWIF